MQETDVLTEGMFQMSGDTTETELLCMVCRGDTDVIVCSTCTSAFHLDCHQPPLRRPPRYVLSCLTPLPLSHVIVNLLGHYYVGWMQPLTLGVGKNKQFDTLDVVISVHIDILHVPSIFFIIKNTDYKYIRK